MVPNLFNRIELQMQEAIIMPRSGEVQLTKLQLSKAEVMKFSSKDLKHYVMVTCMLRDLLLLQKILLFSGRDKPSTAAYAANTLFLRTIIASKLHEAGNFLGKEGVLKTVPAKLEVYRDSVQEFYGDSEIAGLLGFIRNKFGFHYDTYKDLDNKLDDAFQQLGELEMWLSVDDAGNDIFSSTNGVISEVVYAEAKRLGFCGDKDEFTTHLFDIVLKSCRVVANFGRGYLVSRRGDSSTKSLDLCKN